MTPSIYGFNYKGDILQLNVLIFNWVYEHFNERLRILLDEEHALPLLHLKIHKPLKSLTFKNDLVRILQSLHLKVAKLILKYIIWM